MAEGHAEPLAPSMSLRNGFRWGAPVVRHEDGELADWEILLRLTEELGGGPTGMKAIDAVLGIARRLGWKYNPEQTLDMLLRIGPHGDRYLPWRRGLNLAKVKASPYGVDLGPARTGIEHRMQHSDRKIHLVAAPFMQAMDELEQELNRTADAGELLLIGRRELRTNNSWMHNVPALVSGRDRCVLYVHRATRRSDTRQQAALIEPCIAASFHARHRRSHARSQSSTRLGACRSRRVAVGRRRAPRCLRQRLHG
jgi:hypothetical protein